jgi:hypothetical protein
MQAFFVTLISHMITKFLMAAWRDGRWWTWVVGALAFGVAMIFRDRPRVRTAFLAATPIAAASLLLAHVHYSIDVLGAEFITPTIFRLAEWCFPRDLAFGRTHALTRPAQDRELAPVGQPREHGISEGLATPWPADLDRSEPAAVGSGAASRGEM